MSKTCNLIIVATFNQDVELRNDVVPKRNVGGLAYDYVIGEDSPFSSSSSTRRPPQLKISPLLPQEDTHSGQKRFNQYNNAAPAVPKRKVPIVETRTPAYFDNIDVVPTTPQPYYYPNYYGKTLLFCSSHIFVSWFLVFWSL